MHQRAGKELEEADFISFGLIDEKGMLTNAGALLADESPMRHSRLFCTRWNGLDKVFEIMEALDDKEFTESLLNPIIADVFSRINYMERRGSGFKKIKYDYRRAVNYRPELALVFYLDISSFWVTFYNLNYNVAVEEAGDKTGEAYFIFRYSG